MNYSEVAIMLGNKCTADCDICCIESNMNCNEKLDFMRIKEFILSSRDSENIKVFNFSGGEAFLYYEELLDLVSCCKRLNKYTNVITNGFWAGEYNTTYLKLKKMKETGLSSIGLSYDDFHKKYVNIENIKNILKATKELDMKVGIQSVILNGFRNYDWVDKIGKDLVDVSINFISCDQIGRAEKMINSDMFIRETGIERCVCRKGGTFCVSYDGRVWPCCSPYVFSSNISVGNIYDEIITMNEALKKLENNVVLKILRNKGFDFFVDIVKVNKLIKLPNKLISSCELCKMLFAQNTLKKMYPFIIEKLDKDHQCRTLIVRNNDEV